VADKSVKAQTGNIEKYLNTPSPSTAIQYKQIKMYGKFDLDSHCVLNVACSRNPFARLALSVSPSSVLNNRIIGVLAIAFSSTLIAFLAVWASPIPEQPTISSIPINPQSNLPSMKNSAFHKPV
jgi:hypothetical protein